MKRISLLLMIIYSLVVFDIQSYAETNDNESIVGINESITVGINDVLEIIVLGQDNLKKVAMVTTDGAITFPYIGTVYVAGKKLVEIEKYIVEKLSEGYIKYPVVSVSLVKSNEKVIYSYGQFNARGKFLYNEKLTLLKALSLAGGISEGGLYGKVIVRRQQKDRSGNYKDIAVSEVNNGFIEDRKIQNMSLKPDDILIAERSKTFLVQGEVLKRGRFVLQKNMTVVRALLEAGGVSQDGLNGKVKVRRKQEGASGKYNDIAEAKLYDGGIENSKVDNMILEPDDILVVERNKSFLIQGEVSSRGRVVLENDMTVLRALLQVGGVNADGRYGKIRIRRKQGTAGYKDIAESNIINGAIENHEVEEMYLEPDDILIIDKNDTYFIYGEAHKTGEFVLKNNMTVFNALTIAGGFTKWGSGNRVKILRQSIKHSGFETLKVNINDVIKGNADADIYLEPGDTIIISSGVF